jgi:hypothetical protein
VVARGVIQALRSLETGNGEAGTASDASTLLVHGLRNRDARAFEQAVARYSGSMLAVARYQRRGGADAGRRGHAVRRHL